MPIMFGGISADNDGDWQLKWTHIFPHSYWIIDDQGRDVGEYRIAYRTSSVTSDLAADGLLSAAARTIASIYL